jgi:hypothetical protein
MIPVSATMLILFVFLMSVAHVIAKNNHTPEGLITPFGGMLAGYLFCDVSPLRRFYLNYRLRQIQAETADLRRQQSAKAETARSRLRVIEGGAGKNDDDDDKRYLN